MMVAPRIGDVVARLRALRRRLNFLTTQRALAVCTTAALLTLAGFIVLALRAPANAFAPAAWLALGAVCGIAGVATWRAWRAWLSEQSAAHLADRRAALDDRLATLLAAPRPSASSALLPLLIEQTLARTPQWGVDALAPRRVARSLALVPLALAILVATAFYARPPGRGATSVELAATQRQNREAPEASARGALTYTAPQAGAGRKKPRQEPAVSGSADDGNQPAEDGRGTPGDTAPQAEGASGQPAENGSEEGDPQPASDSASASPEGEVDAPSSNAASDGGDPAAEAAEARQDSGESGERERSESSQGGESEPGEDQESGSDQVEQRESAGSTLPSAQGSGESVEDEESEPGWRSDPLAALRSAIRSALGAETEEPLEGEPADLEEAPTAVEVAEIPDGSETEATEERGAEPGDNLPADDAESTAYALGADAQQEEETTAEEAKPALIRGGPGSDASGGSAGTTGPEGLYKKPDAATEPTDKGRAGKGGKLIAIRLGTLATDQTNPSGGHGPRPDNPIEAEALAALASGSALPELSPEQSTDAALQKVEVAPEYEAIVRRIFTRE